MTDWYFAYGSNLWIDQVVERTGSIHQGDDRPQIALLADYRLVFNMQDELGEVFANIMPGGDGVVGVVYRLTHEALERMDLYEQGYLRRRVHVSIQNGDLIEAITYVAEPANLAHGGKPSVEYLRRIVRGARHHGLPEEYIRNLEKHHDELLLLASVASALPPTE
jgi:gamma-glutamylcyclotransferase